MDFLFFLHLCFRIGFCFLVCKSCFSSNVVFCMFVFATFLQGAEFFFFAKGFDLFFAWRVFFSKKKNSQVFFFNVFFFCGGRGRLFFSEGFVLFFFEVFVFSKRGFVFFFKGVCFLQRFFFHGSLFFFFFKEFVFPMRWKFVPHVCCFFHWCLSFLIQNALVFLITEV